MGFIKINKIPTKVNKSDNNIKIGELLKSKAKKYEISDEIMEKYLHLMIVITRGNEEAIDDIFHLIKSDESNAYIILLSCLENRIVGEDFHNYYTNTQANEGNNKQIRKHPGEVKQKRGN